MSDEPRATASSAYAMSQLWHALEAAERSASRADRERAQVKADRWRAVLSGMSTGQLTIGSRTPVADTPAWVTLEVAHGGFATGRYLAEAPLDAAENEKLQQLPSDSPGETDRERLNLWYLSDEGLRELGEALALRRFRVDLPEESALLVVTWLLAHDRYEAALELVDRLRPLMHRLRFSPVLTEARTPSGVAVRLETVGHVSTALRDARTPDQLVLMRRTLQVWNPLYDRLVSLWADTMEGDLPELDDAGQVIGGWPGQVVPPDWRARRQAWLDDYASAAAAGGGGRHTNAKSNFARLRAALEGSPDSPAELDRRTLGWVRRVLASTVTAHGAPGTERRASLRSTQAVIAASPTHADLALLVAGRLDRFPADGGLPSLDPVLEDVAENEQPLIPAGTVVPGHVRHKVERALEAPIEELVARGVIPSGEVLARVLPQISAQLLASEIDDPELSSVYAQTYAAFRRRRSLLLLNLESQVRFEELPWIGVVEPLRHGSDGATSAARQTLSETTLLALPSFPQAILPNPLVREMGALATQAGLKVPLVEEVAADIFMGAFTAKWRDAARIASRAMHGTLYGRYYDIPEASYWERDATASSPRWWSRRRWGRETAEDFAQLCSTRSIEAGKAERASYVAGNGAILEQSQILTTQNLAQLVESLELHAALGDMAPDLAGRTLHWIVERQTQPWNDWRATLQMLKNTAYALRQAIFYMSFCSDVEQARIAAEFSAEIPVDGPASALRPVADGLVHAAAGGRFDESGLAIGGPGRRFLGWSVGRHWLIGDSVESASPDHS